MASGTATGASIAAGASFVVAASATGDRAVEGAGVEAARELDVLAARCRGEGGGEEELGGVGAHDSVDLHREAQPTEAGHGRSGEETRPVELVALESQQRRSADEDADADARTRRHVDDAAEIE